MKVLLAHKFFYMLGGAEVFFFETARLLRENGHSVLFFSTDDPRNITVSDPACFVKAPEYGGGSVFSRALEIPRAIYSSKVAGEFESFLLEHKPDIVHVFAIHVHLTPSILKVCAKHSIPVVMSCNDYKHICPNYKLYHHGRICGDCEGGRFYKAALNRCCKNSFLFSAVSALEAYVHYGIGVYSNNVTKYLFSSQFMAKETNRYWGGGLDFDILRNPFESKKYLRSKNIGQYVLYFGRLVEEKGVDVLLKAAKRLPDIPFKIVGEGEQGAELLEFAKVNGLENVEFLGPKWGGDLNAVLDAARFVVVPSLWHENFPYVILQSFSCGKPVVGSDKGGIPEMVEHGSRGYVYSAFEDAELASAVSKLWNDLSLTLKMGDMAKLYADSEFNDDVQYKTLIRIYESVGVTP